MKKVLLIEDLEKIQEITKIQLAGQDIEFLQAFNIRQAKKILRRRLNELDIICFDHSMPTDLNRNANTLFLIEKYRQEFSGIMIAASSSSENRSQQMEAGCDIEVISKDKIGETIINLINK